MKYGFLFGAGAEACYGLPLGSEFTRETICRKKDKLYEALKENFYARYNDENYAGKYKNEFIFTEKSHTLKKILKNAARLAKENPDKKIDEQSKEIIDLVESDGTVKKDNTKKFDENVKDFFDNFIANDDENKPDNGTKSNDENKSKDGPYSTLEEHLTYYGTIEKDFSCIINPKEASTHRFWRLINYFWGAYFCILLPILKNSKDYKDFFDKDKDSKYKFVLENIKEITEYIYSDSVFDGYSYNRNDSRYYDMVLKLSSELNPPDYVLTTNYTPFVKECCKEPIYLSGELSHFEIPQQLTVKDLSKESLKDGEFVFPFLMTQAPVKPIINTYQLKNYSRALEALKEMDILIVIGYSFCDADSHINALIRDFVLNKKLVYVDYFNEEKKDEENGCEDEKEKRADEQKGREEEGKIRADKQKDYIIKKLKASGAEDNIKVISSNGDTEKLKKELLDILNQY